ncbi:hypothetical protein KM043_010580 [Ampulex compressa]|nr:hypothetical protein KM043_010580 [Ampulex compressa]
MSGEQFSLVWNSFPRNLSSGLYTLLTDEQLVDVTLAAEGQILRAHKLILSVCSTYFRELFKGNSCKHPIVILKDVNYRDLSAMLHFMYQGEVNIKQEDIASFLKVAETLQIKGLTTENDEKLEETLAKNVDDLDDLFEDDAEKINSGASNILSDSTFEKLSSPSQNDQRSQRRRVHSEESLKEAGYVDNCLTSEIVDRPETESGTDYGLQNACNVLGRCENMEMRTGREQPLDCTADVAHLQAKHEPLDYTLETDTEARYRSYMPNKILYKPEDNAQIQEFAPDMQLVPHNQNSQTQPFGLSDIAPPQSDFGYDAACHSKGRRTVKGIPNSSLPLETTLRVVSELGPTLRMERGKIIRMYSCPWCLRHFTRKENLKLHVRYIHGPLESLTCKLCGNKYKNSNSLRVHSYLYHNTKRDKHNKPLVTDGI